MQRLLPVLILALSVGCDGGEDTDDGYELCHHEPALSYDNWGKGFMAQYCAGCHSTTIPTAQRMGAPAYINLDTYEGVLANVENVAAHALLPEPDMPPTGGPFEWELYNLEEWITCTVRPEAEIWRKER